MPESKPPYHITPSVGDHEQKPHCITEPVSSIIAHDKALGAESHSGTDPAVQVSYQRQNQIDDSDPDKDENIDLAVSLMAEGKANFSLANLETVVFLLRQLLDGFGKAHPFRLAVLRDLASALCLRFMYTNQVEDLTKSLMLRNDIVDATMANNLRPDYTPKSSFSDHGNGDTSDLMQMTKGMLIDIQKSTDLQTVNTAVFLLQSSLALLRTNQHSKRLTALTTLADGLYARFHHSHDIADLNDAIFSLKDAAKCCVESCGQQVNIGCRISGILAAQFDFTDNIHDLQRALFEFLDVDPAEPGVGKDNLISMRLDLATQFHSQFYDSGKMDDLNTAIALMRQGLSLGGVKNNIVLNNLANALWTRFKQGGGQRSDLEEAIYFHRQACELLPSTHPSRGLQLNNLANVLSSRFEETGQKGDLDEAIFLLREALLLQPSPHPARSLSLGNLAVALEFRFEQGGQPTDLDESISVHRQALELHPLPNPNRPASLNNLANALSTRFKQGGHRSDLDESISLHRQALELRPPLDPLRSLPLSNLANGLWIRFNQVGQQSDLDEAISHHRQALNLRLPPHPLRSLSLSNLANVLLTQFERGKQRGDLDEPISLLRQALYLQPSPHPARASSLNNLANALDMRFQESGLKNDLDESISLQREALDLQPSPHPTRSTSLNNLATALSNRFQQEGQRGDLDEAIYFLKQALDLQPSPHPDRSASLRALANLLVDAHLTDGDYGFLEQAMSLFFAATQCPSQSPSRRLSIAKNWIHHADNHKHSCTINAYEAALQALPQVAALNLDIQARQEALSAGTDGLARDASRCAIRAGDLVKAIEFLEAGRSIFWSQVLSLRSPFDQLAPEAATRLRNIANALEVGSHRKISPDISDNRTKLSLDQETSRLNRLSEEWEKGIDEVRKLKGFEDFLRPHRLSALQSAASAYPVVVLVANDDGSHCLILTSTTIHHIDLPSLRTSTLQQLVRLVQAAVSDLTVSRSSVEPIMEHVTALLGENRGARRKAVEPVPSDDVFNFVLRILWDRVVKPVIDLLKIQKSCSGELPVLQWCPTGTFTFLPIHAAGCYDVNLSSECASDYFVSSYIPTIGALLNHDPTPSTENFKMTVVIQSTELPSTKTELKNIERHVSSDVLVKLGIPGIPAKIEAVASCLSNSSIVHFACHGKQDPSKPLDSGLELDDGLLRVSRIMKESMPNGSLAFLCACETGKGDENLPDEAMSVGASLLFSGFRRVIATMWEMVDQDGPAMADAFYEELFRGLDGKPAPKPDIRKSARALDVAVKKLRYQNVSFRRWVPFIHMG